jgi:hypothetical protein
MLALACLGAAAPAFGDTATVPCDRDNTLYESSTGALSNGAGPTLFAGRTAQISNSRRRGLVHFDVASLVPSGSTISAVTLRMQMSQAASSTSQAVTLQRVAADWGEGTSNAGSSGGSGAASTAGDATWKHRFFSATLWSALGGDFVPAASATCAVGADGPYTWGSTPGMVADVQGWLDAPGSNFGWLVLGGEATVGTAKRFETREATDPAARPALTITFTPGGTPASAATWGRIRAAYR